MKNYTLKGFSSLLLLLFCTALGAQDFKVGGIYYNILSKEDMTVVVTSHKDAARKPDKRYSGVVKIPSTVTYKKKDYKVVAVAASAFNDCSALTSIELSEGIAEIGDKAFYGCSALASVELPKGITEIGGLAFGDCVAIKEIKIPSSVTKIGLSAFYNCNALNTVEIEDLSAWCRISFVSLMSTPVQSSLLLNGEVLTELVIPDDVTEIPMYAFRNCKNIVSVRMSDNVISIGRSAFSDCEALTAIEFSNNLTKIGRSAFTGCGFKELELPNKVSKIEGAAFEFCPNLTSVTLPASVKLEPEVFSCCDNLKTIKQGDKILTVEELETVSDETVYQVVEKLPEFPGGMAAMMKYIRENIQYPSISLEEKSQGRTYVSFIVSSTGEIRDVEVHRSSGDKYLDKEAERLVKSMPKWTPGMQSGKNVAVQYTLPVVFRLYDGKATKSKNKRK